jgi:hypothetical protein
LVELHVAVKRIIAAPLAAPETKLMLSAPTAVEVGVERARTAVGRDGVPTVIGFEIDPAPVPTWFVAATVNVYVVPFTRLVMCVVVVVAATAVGVCATQSMYGVTM